MAITVEELDLEIHQLIDIREDYERVEYQHPQSLHIPMESILEKASSLDKDITFVVHCASGIRSSNIVTMLQAKGLKNFISLDGGADALKHL